MFSVLSAAVSTILAPYTRYYRSRKFGVHAIGPASFRRLSSSQLNHNSIEEQSNFPCYIVASSHHHTVEKETPEAMATVVNMTRVSARLASRYIPTYLGRRGELDFYICWREVMTLMIIRLWGCKARTSSAKFQYAGAVPDYDRRQYFELAGSGRQLLFAR